ncbi:serologically defined colon cancer antigen 8 homolog isoform X3 [Narcine bancroftii]|uniref:serologically defined colon cancer antigen 8 homolog isoform X3 n=1 Tax=Narcine bancroftii TaxID=1343680 RepID=UPI003831CA5C
MESSSGSDVRGDLDTYLKGLRERANESIKKLKCSLEEKLPWTEPCPVDQSDPVLGNTANLSEKGESHSEIAWQELQHSHAVNELRALLQQQEIKERAHERSGTGTYRMNLGKDSDQSTSIQDLVPILNDQSEYIQHLEGEIKLFREEFVGVKQRVQVVVVENEKLQEELKSKRMQDAMNDTSVCSLSHYSKTASLVDQKSTRTLKMQETSSPEKQQNQPALTLPQKDSISIAEEVKKWQLEVENLENLYQGKMATVELQVSLLRKDLTESQKQCQELIERLKHQESLLSVSSADRVGGLCLKCAQHEAVMARTHSDIHMQTIDSLRNERDELMCMLSNMRSNLTEMQARENSAYQQVKQATEIAEEANLEKIQAVLHCEQLKSEMLRQKEGLERELACQQEKVENAKKNVQEEMRKQQEELTSKVNCLSENVAYLEGQLQRLKREKDSACSQLEATQQQLKSTEMEINKVQHKLELEINETKCHLEHVQQDAAQTKGECLKLIELLSKAEHQLHLTRMEKDSLLRSHSDDVKALAFQSKHREQELTEKIQQMEAQRDKTVNELEALLSSQSALSNKLKTECCTLSQKLQKITEKNRSEVGQLCQEKEYLQERLEKLQARNDEMENQCIQHGTIHERMMQRLQQLDQHSQASAQQVVELLQKQNELMRERQTLQEKLQCLQSSGNVTDKVAFFYYLFHINLGSL